MLKTQLLDLKKVILLVFFSAERLFNTIFISTRDSRLQPKISRDSKHNIIIILLCYECTCTYPNIIYTYHMNTIQNRSEQGLFRVSEVGSHPPHCSRLARSIDVQSMLKIIISLSKSTLHYQTEYDVQYLVGFLRVCAEHDTVFKYPNVGLQSGISS